MPDKRTDKSQKNRKDAWLGRIKGKKPRRRTQTAVITAALLFLITFFIQFAAGTLLPPRANEITDWRFACGKSPQEIQGELGVYRQATGENRVSKDFGSDYMRLQYTVPELKEDVRLVIKTAYNPIRVDINGETVLLNGYGEQDFTGNSYQSLQLEAGPEQTLDIYLCAPLAFSLEAYMEPVEISAGESFSRYLGFGISAAAMLLGVSLFLLGIFLAAKSSHVRRLLLLAGTVFFGGATALLYTFTRTTALLSSPYWFAALLLAELLLMLLVYTTILSCCDKAFKNAALWIPVVILCALIPIFLTAWAVRVTAVIVTAAQLFIVIRANAAFSHALSADVPYVGTVRGLLFYAALTGLYNTCSLFLGLRLLSGYLFALSITLLCIVIFVVYCRQIIYLALKKYERIRQMYTDSAWIEDITGLIARMFLQKEETTFLTEVARGLSDIIEKNSQLNDEEIHVHTCVGILENGVFKEIFNDGPVEGCDYRSIYGHLKNKLQKLLIGGTSADMLFTMDDHSAIVHFENILCGMTSGIENIMKTAYLNLSSAYQNLNLKKDVSDIQEELFLNLATVIEQKYKSTKSHLFIVSALSYELCRELGMSEERARLISLAAMTHDIGKIVVSENILEKEGPLDDAEFAQMKQHTEAGFNILSLQSGSFFETAAVIARQHHENFDGSGYMGLSRREIAPEARLVRVIDVVDALMSKRSYKESWNAQEVKQYIEDEKGRLFDPAVADAFLGCADELLALRERILEDEQL